MEEIGKILKSARESKNVTLDEIQERTKIRKRYLEAIEDGKFSVLPGMVYAKGFIKIYAEQLGLDGHALLKEYGLLEEKPTVKQEEPLNSTPPNQEKITQSRVSTSRHESGNHILPQVIIGILIIGLLGVGYWLLSNWFASSEPPNSQVQQPSTPPPAQSVTPAPTPEPEPPKQTGPLKAETKGSGRSDYKVTGDTIKLELNTAKGDCWLEITVDGEKKLTKLVAKETALSFEGSKEVRVLAGFSPALTITVNGQPVELENVNGPYVYLFQKK